MVNLWLSIVLNLVIIFKREKRSVIYNEIDLSTKNPENFLVFGKQCDNCHTLFKEDELALAFKIMASSLRKLLAHELNK